MSEDAIQKFIESKKLVCPSIITNTTFHPRHMEMRCRTEEETKVLLNDLSSNIDLTNDLSFEIKRPPLFKTILFSVPEGTTTEKIIGTLNELYNFEEEDVTFLKATPSKREGYKDWHFLMLDSLARDIISEGGIPLGLSVQARPQYSGPALQEVSDLWPHCKVLQKCSSL